MSSVRASRMGLCICLAAVAGAWNAERPLAQEIHPGKTITLIVGNPAGSGYDAYARLLARHMPKYLPAKPSIIIQNMPGAGSVKAADYTFNIAPKDGTAFALTMPGTLIEPLTGNPANYRYDPTRFGYVGTMDSGTRICVTRADAKAKSIAEAQLHKTIVAATAPGSSAFYYPKFLNAFAGTKFEVVTGYPGPSDVFVAMDRGEADGACGLDVSTFKALRPDWLKAKTVNLIVQVGLTPSPELLALGMPSVWDFISDQEHRAIVELIASQQVFQRPFLTPPGMPPERLALLRSAFMAAMRDPELLAEAAHQSLDVNPKSGEDVEALIDKIYRAPKELVAKMAAVIQP